jgi:hypothetical protein
MTSQGVMLALNSSGKWICQNTSTEAYGVVKCLTKSIWIDSASEISLYHHSFRDYQPNECAVASQCVYEQQSSSANMPAFTAIDNSVSNTVVFTGTNFFTSGYNAHVEYGGAEADTVTIDSATQVTATWTYGMPPVGESLIPALWFNSTSSETIHIAYHDTSDRTLNITKTLGSATGPTGLQCSFAGGCLLEVTAEGLSSILKSDSTNNYITVCDEKCEFNDTLSNSAKSVC